MAQVPTIFVEHPDIPGERMRINRHDFDPAKHTEWQEPQSGPKGKAKDAPKAPAIGTVQDAVSELFTDPAEGPGSEPEPGGVDHTEPASAETSTKTAGGK